MSKENIYRGKRKDNKEWVYGSNVSAPALPFNDGKEFIVVFVGVESGEPIFDWYEVIPETIGQYTTVDDLKGNKIFENDILDGHSDGPVRITWQDDAWEGVFSDEANIMLAEITKYFGNNATVIGNMHDNPELLG